MIRYAQDSNACILEGHKETRGISYSLYDALAHDS
jgi:hypothetical protein